nr:hypothetical protein [Pseudomonas sp.]
MPKAALARPLPTRQTRQKGRLNFLYAGETMRLTSAYEVQPPQRPTRPDEIAGFQAKPPTPREFSVLNDFRYLTDSDKELLGAATGERIEPGITDRTGPASAFAQQLALDRRTGMLAPNQDVTAVYLRNAADAIDKANAGRRGFTNPTRVRSWIAR